MYHCQLRMELLEDYSIGEAVKEEFSKLQLVPQSSERMTKLACLNLNYQKVSECGSEF